MTSPLDPSKDSDVTRLESRMQTNVSNFFKSEPKQLSSLIQPRYAIHVTSVSVAQSPTERLIGVVKIYTGWYFVGASILNRMMKGGVSFESYGALFEAKYGGMRWSGV